MAKQQKYGMMPAKTGGKAMMAKSPMAKAAPKDQAPPTPVLPVRQRYRLGGGC